MEVCSGGFVDAVCDSEGYLHVTCSSSDRGSWDTPLPETAHTYLHYQRSVAPGDVTAWHPVVAFLDRPDTPTFPALPGAPTAYVGISSVTTDAEDHVYLAYSNFSLFQTGLLQDTWPDFGLGADIVLERHRQLDGGALELQWRAEVASGCYGAPASVTVPDGTMGPEIPISRVRESHPDRSMFPSLSIGDDGTVHAVYTDRLRAPEGNVHLAVLRPGAEAFECPLSVTGDDGGNREANVARAPIDGELLFLYLRGRFTGEGGRDGRGSYTPTLGLIDLADLRR